MTELSALSPATGLNPFVASLRRFLAIHQNLAGKRILICGNNVSVFVQALQDAGAQVFVACGTPVDLKRIKRRFHDLPVAVRDATFTNPDRHNGSYDLIIIWDGVGASLPQWLQGTLQLSPNVWADSLMRGWIQIEFPLTEHIFFPDAAVQQARQIPFDQVRDPLLAHVHLPKNGGSSINDLLFESFGYRYRSLYVHDPNIQQDEDFLNQQLPLVPQAQVISSHNFRAFPEKVGHRPMLYFTFLRHPLARHLSYYRYAKKHYHSLSPEHLKVLPENFLEMSPQDYLRFEAELHAQGHRFGQLHTFDPQGDLGKAHQILSDFFLVGVTEQLERSLNLLRKKLSCVGYHLVEFPVHRANTTEDLYDQTGDMMADPDVQAAAGYLEKDQQLYDWALRRFEHECLMYGV